MIANLKFLGIYVLFSILLGCSNPEGINPDIIRDYTKAWFDCIECDEGQKERLVELGSESIPILRAAIIDGPPLANRLAYIFECENIHFLISNCHEDEIDFGGHTSSSCSLREQTVFCRSNLEEYEIAYRMKAITILSEIGGKPELEFLKEIFQLINKVRFPNYFRKVGAKVVSLENELTKRSAL